MTSRAKSYVEYSNSGANQSRCSMDAIGSKLNFAIGASSRSLGAIVTLPITIVKTRIEATKHHGYTGIVDALTIFGGMKLGVAYIVVYFLP